jgi:hypothetical protein
VKKGTHSLSLLKAEDELERDLDCRCNVRVNSLAFDVHISEVIFIYHINRLCTSGAASWLISMFTAVL